MIEDILLNEFSAEWKRLMPVLLITYDSGNMDVYCQNGDHHVVAMKKARKILAGKNIRVEHKPHFTGQSGSYYHAFRIVSFKKKIRTHNCMGTNIEFGVGDVDPETNKIFCEQCGKWIDIVFEDVK